MYTTKFSLLCLLLLISSNLWAQFITLDRAKQYAESFLQNPVEYVEDAIGTIQKSPKNASNSEQSLPLIYVFEADSQWVVVSADERTTPILAYSYECSFPSMQEMAPAMLELLTGYQHQVRLIRDYASSGNNTQVELENEINSLSSLPSHVSPLLEQGRSANKWNQEGNSSPNSLDSHSYNKFCPFCGTSEHSKVGCVALAMSQIMWYWRWPSAALVVDYIDGPVLREYDWSMMPSEITNQTPIEQVDMLAHLLADVGPAVEMNYSCSNSTTTMDKVNAAFNAFGYQSNAFLRRDQFSDTEWKQILKTELAQDRPVLYSGVDIIYGGHCFVVDGYDIWGRFHINLGHGEQAGYFTLDNIHERNRLLTYEYNLYQQAVINIHPNYMDCLPIFLPKDILTLPSYLLSSFPYSGGLTIYNATVGSGENKHITSGEYVRILPETHFQRGSKVHIDIQDVACGYDYETTNASPMYAPRQEDITTDTPQLASTMSVSISPNPVHDVLTIEGCESYAPELTIHSMHGQIVLRTIGTSADVSALPNGIYLLTCNDNGHITQHKFIKQ